MVRKQKGAQLQIRVSAAQKARIQRFAKQASMDMSAYVLSRVLPAAAQRFQACVHACAGAISPSFALAELNSLLTALTADELRDTVAAAPETTLSPFVANYVAAMVETACARRSIAVPAWAPLIAPLADPVFGSPLQSLRLYLLTNSPAPFRRRNLFIDSTLGQRV